MLLASALSAHAEPPARVVSLAPNLTDMVRELGVGDVLAGVTPFCAAPDGVPRVPGGLQPEAETVLELGPDLVLASSITPEPTLRQLRELGIRTETFETGSLEEISRALRRVAGILGVKAPGDKARPAVKSAALRSAVLLFGAETGFSAGHGTHAHEILGAAGLRNIAEETAGPWPQLGEEFLLASDPDVIIVADYGGASQDAVVALLRGHPVRRHLRAVRAGRVVVVPARAFTVPGPAALEAGQKLRAEVEKL